ncbi:GIY-YIG nuclease family protein [Peribacillus loiseleuriae]|uniref:GIY-YIG nuclease family protein n=1 Tax=Peribacillus loiseleuriae TaxID=1679170 RepID=UPI003D007E03
MSKIEIKTMPFDKTSIDCMNGYYTDYPVVYFLNNDTTVYIGETVAVRNRMRDHLNNSERKSLKKMSLIIHEKFNRSATYNIETKLINYFLADERYKLQNKSQTVNSVMRNYYEKNSLMRNCLRAYGMSF